MSDADLRTLEREPRTGDDAAVERWLAARRRAGDPYTFGALEPEDARTFRACEALRAVARTKRPVVIVGGSVAQTRTLVLALHQTSGRKGPLLFEDLSELPETLGEAQMFGFARTDMGGQPYDQPGAFELANGGTCGLFLRLPLAPHLQRNLKRVLDDGRTCRVGWRDSVVVDVRLVLAGNPELVAFTADWDPQPVYVSLAPVE